MFELATDDTQGQTQEITQWLDELVREGARRMTVATLETEVTLLKHHLNRYPRRSGCISKCTCIRTLTS